MIERGFGLLVAAAVLASVAPANGVGNVRRERPSRRPYIVEVGEPHSISMETLQREADNLSELREYMQDYGVPDYAEIQEIEPQWPWEASEVRVYYLQRNLEVDFGHVILSGAMPDLGIEVFSGQIPPDKAHQIEVALQSRQVATLAPAGPTMTTAARPGELSEALVARIEAAAERATQAADRAVADSDAAARAADRTERIVNKFAQPRRRHR
jgi:hypothetical protein